MKKIAQHFAFLFFCWLVVYLIGALMTGNLFAWHWLPEERLTFLAIIAFIVVIVAGIYDQSKYK